MKHALTFLFFLTMSVLVMNTVAVNITTHVPGPESDFYHFHWNFWWVREALTDADKQVYFTDYLHVPFEQNLAYHTLTLSWFPFYVVGQPLLGNIMTVNLMFLLSLALSGYLTTLFLTSENIPKSIALLAGAFLITSPYTVFHVQEFHLNIIMLFWLPGIALLWRQVAMTRRVMWAVGLGVALWAMWLTGSQWLLWSPFLMVPYALLTLYRLQRQYWPRTILLGALAVAIMGLLGWLIAPWQEMLAFDDQVNTLDYEAAEYWALPVEALWGTTRRDQDLGFILLPLVMFSVFLPSRDRLRWLWLAVGIIVLSIAFALTPYHWIHDALGGVYRAPVRFYPVAMLTLWAFIGLSVRQRWLRIPRWTRLAITGILLWGILADNDTFRPLAVYRIPEYETYHEIGDEANEFALVEVPIGVANGWNTVGEYRPIEQYYGIYHTKPMVSAFVAREDSRHYLYYERSPLWNWLAGNIPLDAAAARAEFDTYLVDYPIGYIVVDQASRGPNAPLTLQWLQFFNVHPDVCYWQTEGDRVFYRTAVSGCRGIATTSIDVGSNDLGRMGFGWSWIENFGGQSSRWMAESGSFYVDVPVPANVVTLTALAFQFEREVTVYINGDAIGSIIVTPDGFQIYSLSFDTVAVEEIALQSDSTEMVGERSLSIAVSHIEFDER